MSTSAVASKVRNILCWTCVGKGRSGGLTSGACLTCSGYGRVSEHQVAECWCDGTSEAWNHMEH